MPRQQMIMETARAVLDTQDQALESQRTRQMLSVAPQAATGSADINATFGLDRKHRLVFIRCHFSGTSGKAALKISVSSAGGAAYDTELYRITGAGVGRDVHFRVPEAESREPSAWTFQAGDRIRVQWTNPDSGNITWGLEVGFAIAT